MKKVWEHVSPHDTPGVAVVLSGNCHRWQLSWVLGGSCHRWQFSGGSCRDGSCPGGRCPDTITESNYDLMQRVSSLEGIYSVVHLKTNGSLEKHYKVKQ